MIRSKRELGELILDNMVLFDSGLCSWVNKLYYEQKLLTENEVNYLIDLIASKRPIFIPLVNNIYNSDKKTYDDAYYWESGFIKPRIKWIKKHLIKG